MNQSRILKTALSAAVAVVFAWPFEASAKGPLDSRITIEVKSAPLTTFLDKLSEQTKLNFIVKEGLENERVTASIKNLPVRKALDVVAETNGLRYRKLASGKTFVVERADSPEVKDRFACPGLPKTRVSVRIKNGRLSDFVSNVTSQAGVNFSLASGLEDRSVTVELANVSVEEALQVVLEIKNLTVSHIRTRSHAAEQLSV